MNKASDFRAACRAIRGLRRRLSRLHPEAVAKALDGTGIKHGDLHFMEDWLSDCRAAMREPPKRYCEDCGRILETYVRPDTKHCSKKCRQRAYRKRVTDRARQQSQDLSRATDVAHG